MVYARRDRELMLHGSAASRLLEIGAGGAPLSACVTIWTGGPIDDAEDLAVPVWTGQLPVALRAMSHIPTPDDVSRFEPPARPHGIDCVGCSLPARPTRRIVRHGHRRYQRCGVRRADMIRYLRFAMIANVGNAPMARSA